MSHQHNTGLDSPPMDKKEEIYEDEYSSAPKVAFDPLNPTQAFDTKGMTETQIVEVRNAAFAAAVAAAPLNPRSKASFMLYFCVFVTFLGSCANGYDGSLFSGISPMTQYVDHFKIGKSGQDESLIFSMYTVGSMVGALFAGPISDIWGRRVGMFSGGLFIVAGMLIVSTANTISQLVGGRFVLGFGIAIMTVGAPAYCVEIAPAQWRGRFVGLYNNGWNGGSIPAAIVCYLCQSINSNWSWRIPMIGQGSYSVMVMVFVWFIPESPRWLLANGRRDEALAFLIKYHGNGDPNSALVLLEMQEMDDALANSTGSDKRWWDYRGLFMTKNSRYRMLSVLLISVFGQFSGNGLGYFQYIIYENLGYTEVKTQLALNLGGSFLSAVCGVTGALFADRMPRIKVLTIGTFILAIFLGINGGLSEVIAAGPKDGKGNPIITNPAYGQGALAANYLFGVVYAFTYTPLQGVYPAENLTSTTRAKGLAASGIIVNLFGFINTYAGPIALRNMKNRYIFVFCAWDLIETAIWWFCGVETVGYTVEALDEVYNAHYPPFASRKKVAVAKVSDGTIVQLQE